MNRVLRAGLYIMGIAVMCGVSAYIIGGGGYGGTSEYYPVTVRVWLNDSFIGGVQPAVSGTTPNAILGMLAAGNDLIYVTDDAPRCPVLSVAWVSPVPGTPANAQIYNATIQCAQSPSNTTQLDVMTYEELLAKVGP